VAESQPRPHDIGLDIASLVFWVHGIADEGKVIDAKPE
jgi:hypothetical protein